MEFRYNLNEIFKSNISKINNTLLPSEFLGHRRNAINCASQVADIIDAMGIASAKAQGLQHAITSADKLRISDHMLYLMIDSGDNNGKGSVVGLLKIGVKNLFLCDETGMVHEKKSLCILDFYVHESKQRSGFGKKLYDFMLYDELIEPWKLAIDKPSVKFLSFLHKHYGLAKIYPQNNNFVVFAGFFDDTSDTSESLSSIRQPSTRKNYSSNGVDNQSASVKSEKYSPNLFGRHTAFKPQDSMGKIIGQGSSSADPSPIRSGFIQQERTDESRSENHVDSRVDDQQISHPKKSFVSQELLLFGFDRLWQQCSGTGTLFC